MSAMRWTPEAQRDLLMAMLTSVGAIKPKWAEVEALMRQWNHNASAAACSPEHFNKNMWKAFKQAHEMGSINYTVASSSTTERRSRAANPQRRRKLSPTPPDDGSDAEQRYAKKKRVDKLNKEEKTKDQPIDLLSEDEDVASPVIVKEEIKLEKDADNDFQRDRSETWNAVIDPATTVI